MEGLTRVTCVIVVLGLVLAGCAKKEETTPAAPSSTGVAAPAQEQPAQQTAAQAAQQAEQTAVKVTQQAVQEANQVKTTAVAAAQEAVAEQTVCPVMKGQPIDKTIFVEYQGKRVYFCCESCKAAFEKEPAKYLADLPQFKR